MMRLLLTEEKDFSDYFEQLIQSNNANGSNAGIKPKSAANWMLGPVRTWLNDENKNIDEFPVSPVKFCLLIKMVEENKLSFSGSFIKTISCVDSRSRNRSFAASS